MLNSVVSEQQQIIIKYLFQIIEVNNNNKSNNKFNKYSEIELRILLRIGINRINWNKNSGMNELSNETEQYKMSRWECRNGMEISTRYLA